MGVRWNKKDVETRGKIKPVVKIDTNALTQHAIRVLDLKGITSWRQNNGGVWDPSKKVFRKNSSTPGVSDILGYCRKTGRIVACEIKTGNDRLSSSQINFLKGINEAGGVAIVVRNVDDLTKLLQQK